MPGSPLPDLSFSTFEQAEIASKHSPMLVSTRHDSVRPERPIHGEAQTQHPLPELILLRDATLVARPLDEVSKRGFLRILLAILIENAANTTSKRKRHRPFSANIRRIPVHAGQVKDIGCSC